MRYLTVFLSDTTKEKATIIDEDGSYSSLLTQLKTQFAKYNWTINEEHFNSIIDNYFIRLLPKPESKANIIKSINATPKPITYQQLTLF